MTLEKAKKEIIKVHEAIIEGRKSGDLTRANKIYESTRKKLKTGTSDSELGFFLNHTANYNLNTEERYVKFKKYVEELTKKKGQTPHSVSSKTPVLINNDPSIVNKIKKDAFKKLPPDAKKQFIEMANSLTYLNCKQNEVLKCAVNKKTKKVSQNKKKKSVKKKSPVLQVKDHVAILKKLQSIVRKVWKVSPKEIDPKLVKEFNTLRKELQKLFTEEKLYTKIEDTEYSKYHYFMSHTLKYILKDKRKTKSVKTKPKKKTIKKSLEKETAGHDELLKLISPIYKVEAQDTIKELGLSVSKAIRSLDEVDVRTPSINKMLLTLKTDLSPRRDLVPVFNLRASLRKLCKTNNEIYLLEGKKGRCLKWDSSELKDIMLRNFTKKEVVDCNKIIGPKQYLSNCWFNTFFMAFFISDSGRKFFRHLRQFMIKGKILDYKTGEEIDMDTELKKPMFMLNALIESCLSGNTIGALNTNEIIRTLHDIKKYNFIGINKAHNPITFYTAIIQLNKGTIHIKKVYLSNVRVDDTIHKLSIDNYVRQYSTTLSKSKIKYDQAPDLYIIEKQSFNRKERKEINKDPKKIPKYMRDLKPLLTIDGVSYKLDSAVLRDNSSEHFSCYITCGDKEKWFDGAGLRRMTNYRWKHLITTNKSVDDSKYTGGVDITGYNSMEWNFVYEYCSFFYYRVK